MPLLSSTPTSDNRTHPPSVRCAKTMRPPPGTIPASTTNYKCRRRSPEPKGGKHTHAKHARLPQTERRRQDRATCRRPPYHDACPDHSGHARTTGTSSPPHDVQGTRPPPPATNGPAMGADGVRLPRAAGQRPGPRRPRRPGQGSTDLVGLGRLERPTSRLSGVRSNQLSYRPERHPAGPDTAHGRRPGAEPRDPPPAGLRSDGCLRRDVQTAAGDFLAIRPVKADRLGPAPRAAPANLLERR